MRWQTVNFDWNQARAFLVTAEEGSLSAAARALGLTQPTLGRQVAALENDLGVTLFERVGRSLALTQAGLELLDHVRSMGDAAGRISLVASGQSQSIEGHVSISATDMAWINHLPPVLAELRRRAPQLEIEIVASNDVSDLSRREADIAIRHARPEQPELIARLVRETTVHLYASKAFLARHGRPTCPEDLSDADFIGAEHPERLIPELASHGFRLTRDNFRLYTSNWTVAWELVKQGLGIALIPEDVAERATEVECVLPDLVAIPIPVWIVTHRELHTSRRIRLVFDVLAEALSATGLKRPEPLAGLSDS